MQIYSQPDLPFSGACSNEDPGGQVRQVQAFGQPCNAGAIGSPDPKRGFHWYFANRSQPVFRAHVSERGLAKLTERRSIVELQDGRLDIPAFRSKIGVPSEAGLRTEFILVRPIMNLSTAGSQAESLSTFPAS